MRTKSKKVRPICGCSCHKKSVHRHKYNLWMFGPDYKINDYGPYCRCLKLRPINRKKIK